ncbi:MAG TPA: biotin--[acetyl-CoA-carboxylase] ligase [Acidimicrobiales bacterium]|nr:biotin--[acetyl-CoA-carboxylase] ligase [Acidimicrobiales bacterium]
MIEERVREDLAASTRFWDIRLLEVTDSTNRVVAELAQAGGDEGIVIATDLQTAGRGRLDRTWEAEPGAGLLVSLLLRPDGLPMQRWHLVTAAAGLAAKDACADVAGVAADLKWPNDLLWQGRKLAGVLAESTAGALVAGMGLNVHSCPPGAAYLDEAAGRRVSRGVLLPSWLRHLDALLDHWDDVAERYRTECATVGRHVLVEQHGQAITGFAEAIDDDGRLVVRPDAGEASEPVAVSAGDVVHVRPGGGPQHAW